MFKYDLIWKLPPSNFLQIPGFLNVKTENHFEPDSLENDKFNLLEY